MQHVVHWEEDGVERLLPMFFLDQVVNMRDPDLGREARVNGTPAGASAVQFLTGVVGVNDVLGLQSQALEISVEERGIGVDVQNAWDADSDLLPVLHKRNAFFR